jgi:hypothetical protein
LDKRVSEVRLAGVEPATMSAGGVSTVIVAADPFVSDTFQNGVF